MVVVNDKANGNPHVGAGSHARPGEGGVSEYRGRACPARRSVIARRCEGRHNEQAPPETTPTQNRDT